MAGSTLLIHFISDFLRDENLRCAVMEDEDDAYEKYGLSEQQKKLIRKIESGKAKRKDILDAISAEIGPFRFEDGAGDPKSVLQYPSGHVVIHKHTVSSSGTQRTVDVVGTGFVSGVTVTFTAGSNSPIDGTIRARSCDKDAWQRVKIEVTADDGTYTMRIDRGGGVYKEVPVTFP